MARKGTKSLHDAAPQSFRMQIPPYREGISSQFKRIMGSAESSDPQCDNEEGGVEIIQEETIGE